MNKEGVGVGWILIDPHSNKKMLACRLEFYYTNNFVEYEALVQGLRKPLDIQVKCIEVFDDSQIVTKKVINSINCTSNHLKKY